MGLFLAANLIAIFKSVNALLVAGLIAVGLRKLRSRAQKITFTAMLLFFLSSTLFFSEEGLANDWTKHSLFYIGQLFFYFFLSNLIKSYFKNEEIKEDSARRGAGHAVAPAVIAVPLSFTDWFSFLTQQGLQHILTVPIFLLIVTIVRIQYLSIESKHFKQALNLFLWAALALLLIHIGEFMIESQELIPSLAEKSEFIEFLWFYLGMLLFYMGMKKLS